MRRTQCRFMWLVGALLLAGCAVATPPSRLSQYVAPVVADESASPGLPVQRPLRTALVVLADRSAQEAAPGLPEEAQARLAEALRGQVNRGFPIAIERVVNLGEIPVGAPLPNWIDLAGQQGVDWPLSFRVRSRSIRYRCSSAGRPTCSPDSVATIGPSRKPPSSMDEQVGSFSVRRGEPWRRWTAPRRQGFRSGIR